MGAGILLFLMGLACLIGPNVVPNQIPLLGKLILAVTGGLLLIIGVIVVIVTQLYVKASADVALVRTGSRGIKPILNGGTIFIPVIHKLIYVNLKVMKLKIEDKVLICGDYMRAEVDAEFYIRVGPTEDEVKNAAVTLGDRTMQEQMLKELIEEKLTNVLRTVAANMNLVDLNAKRDDFQKKVIEALTTDLGHNGLRLETVAISRLDQAPFDPNIEASNVFDAQGHQNAQVIISGAAIVRNQAKRDAELAIAEKDRDTREKVAEQEFLQERANAQRDANISKAHSEQQREAEVFKQQQLWSQEQARLETEQQIGTRDAEKAKGIQVANIQAKQAALTAEQTQEQAVQVASRQKEIAIAEAEQKRANAQAEQLKAEQLKTGEAQGVLTVEAKAKADREKAVQVINAEQDAEVRRVNEFMQADITAYQTAKVAEGEKNAAEKTAEAIRLRATADRDAQLLHAEGETAVQIVPVNVKNAEVDVQARFQNDVEQKRVEVLRNELDAKGSQQEISVKLEIAKSIIEANKEIGIEQARAMGQALGNANMKFFGNPEMLEVFVKRFSTGQGMNGLMEGLGLEGLGDIGKLLEQVPALRGVATQIKDALAGKGKAKAAAADASA